MADVELKLSPVLVGGDYWDFHPLLQEKYTGLEIARLWSMFRWSLLAETKREFLVPSIVYCEFCLGVLWFWLHNFDPNLAVGGGKRNGATSISWCYIHPSYIKLLRTGVSLGAHASAAQIHKYTLEIQQIRPKYSLYLNCTNFPNDDNFGLRS